jgi:predicted ABC-type ATPase
MTRVSKGGHHVPENKLRERFPRTQQAVSQAISVADAAILLDNSRSEKLAFTPAFICRGERVEYDIRASMSRPPREITAWLDIIVPP